MTLALNVNGKSYQVNINDSGMPLLWVLRDLIGLIGTKYGCGIEVCGALRSLVRRHVQSGRAIVASRYSGTVGVPAFFARRAFPLLESLGPREGCKGVILGSSDALLLDCPDAAVDLDTPEDYARAIAG